MGGVKMDKLKKCSMPSGLVAVFFLFCVVAFSGLQASLVNAELVPVIDKKVEAALLAEDWERVAKLLDSVSPETPSSVLRMIKGHAGLALNRNNGSVTLFYSMTVEDMKKYAQWGEAFASENSYKSMAHYFQGDVYSRIGDLPQAHKHFTKSIETNTSNYLAWNARGVISTLRKEYDNSMKDFNNALSLKPDFIDVNNNIAMMRINQGQGRKGAIKRFQSVIKSDSKFALAYHGLGCLELLKAQRLAPEENQNIQQALELLPDVQDLLIENETSFADAYLDKQAELLYADAGKEGTTIGVNYSSRKTKLLEATKQATAAQEKYINSNFFTKGINENRLRRSQGRVAQLAQKNMPSDWNKYSSSEKTMVTNHIDDFKSYAGRLESSANRGKSFQQHQSRALEVVGTAANVTAIAAPDPGSKTLASVGALAADKWQKNSNFNARGYENSANSARDLKNRLHDLSNT